MRSSELAALAGVTVRALRHYHHLGILDEPERSANGYREYDIRSLVRVLRIKRLAAMGFSLQALPDLLDGDDKQADVLLEQLDRELEAEMERLAAQRTVIAHLRREGFAPDLPPELARHVVPIVAAARSERLARFDREQAILMAHLVDPEKIHLVTTLYDRLAEPGRLAVYAGLNARFDALGQGTTDEEVDCLIRDLTAVVHEFLGEFPADSADAFGDATALLAEYSAEVLNETQLRVIALAQSALEESASPRDQSTS